MPDGRSIAKRSTGWLWLACLGALPMAGATLLFAGTTDLYRSTVLVAVAPFLMLVWSGAVDLPSLVVDRSIKLGAALIGLGLLWGTVFVSLHFEASLLRTAEWLAWALLGAGVARLWALDVRARWLLLGAIPVAFLTSTVLILVRVVVAEDSAGYPWQMATPGYFHLRNLGLFAPLAIGVLAGGLYHFLSCAVGGAERRRWALPCFAALMLAWATLAWSGSRAGVFGSVLILGLMAMSLPREGKRGWLAWCIAAALVGSLLSVPFVPERSGLGLWRILADTVDVSEGADGLASGRLAIWTDAVQRLLQHPLWGFGPDQYQYQEALPKRVFEPHQSLLLMWGETGVAGLAGTAILLWGIGRRYLTQAPRSLPGIVVRSAFPGLLLLGMVDSVTYWTITLLAGAIILGGVLGDFAGDPPARRARRTWGTWLALATAVAVSALFAFSRWQIAQLNRTPGPCDGIVARTVHAFPTSTWGIESWLQEWEQRGDPCDLEAWYQWLISVSPAPYHHKMLYGFFLARKGETSGALALIREGMAETPANMRATIESRYAQVMEQLEQRQQNEAHP